MSKLNVRFAYWVCVFRPVMQQPGRSAWVGNAVGVQQGMRALMFACWFCFSKQFTKEDSGPDQFAHQCLIYSWGNWGTGKDSPTNAFSPPGSPLQCPPGWIPWRSCFNPDLIIHKDRQASSLPLGKHSQQGSFRYWYKAKLQLRLVGPWSCTGISHVNGNVQCSRRRAKAILFTSSPQTGPD